MTSFRIKQSLVVACAMLIASMPTHAQTRKPLPADAADEVVFEQRSTGKALLDTLLAEPAKALSKTQILKARFTKKKHLSEIPQPLVASGEFVFLRDVGVYWHTEKPFDSVFVLTQQGILQRDEGSEALRVSSDKQPAVRVVADIFFALFTLNVSKLETDFEMFGRKQDGRWILGLRPKSAAVASVFKQATVSGTAVVEQVVFTDKRGDRTVIEMSGVTQSADVPAGMRELFKH